MSHVDVIGLFKQAALEVHGRQLGALDAATEISTLGLDSVAVMEMTGCLEERLKIRIPDEELAEVETLGELDTLIRRVIAGKEAPCPALSGARRRFGVSTVSGSAIGR